MRRSGQADESHGNSQASDGDAKETVSKGTSVNRGGKGTAPSRKSGSGKGKASANKGTSHRSGNKKASGKSEDGQAKKRDASDHKSAKSETKPHGDAKNSQGKTSKRSNQDASNRTSRRKKQSKAAKPTTKAGTSTAKGDKAAKSADSKQSAKKTVKTAKNQQSAKKQTAKAVKSGKPAQAKQAAKSAKPAVQTNQNTKSAEATQAQQSTKSASKRHRAKMKAQPKPALPPKHPDKARKPALPPRTSKAAKPALPPKPAKSAEQTKSESSAPAVVWHRLYPSDSGETSDSAVADQTQQTRKDRESQGHRKSSNAGGSSASSALQKPSPAKAAEPATGSAAVSASASVSAPRHVDAIDGLRALAIIGVVAYHARPSLLSGGFLGVTLFFVISGFLITASVERRFASARGFGFWSYLFSKVKRLAIPVFALMVLVVPVTYAVSPGLLPKVHADALPSVLYASNWVYIFRKVPYFAAAGLPSPLTHLWFLAVTMQFYLLWIFALWLMHRLHFRRGLKFTVSLVLAIASSAAMVLLYASTGDVSRVYYGLDTRFSELMIGAMLAFLVANRRSDGTTDAASTIASTEASAAQPSQNRTGSILRALAGLCLLAATVALYVFADGNDTLLYRGGYQLVALMMALLLFVVLDTRNWCSKVLGSRVLRYIGSRSFSIYLVHYPLLEFMNPAIRTSKPAWWELVAQMLVVWLVAEAFYWLVEALRPTARRKPGPFGEVRIASKTIAALGVVVTLVVAFAPCNWTAVAQQRSTDLRREFLTVGNATGVGGAMKSDVLALRRDPVPKPSRNLPPKLVPKAAKVPKNLDASHWTYDAASGTCTADPLIISDSVEMGAHDYVQDHIPAAFQDNLVGRPFGAGLGLYQQHLGEGHNGVLIMALGTNGPINSPQEIEDVIKAANGRPVYFTTVRAPVAWQDSNNAILRSVVAKHKNVGLLDWYTLSNGHAEYFYDDGTHLTPGEGGGREAYGIMVRQALCGQ